MSIFLPHALSVRQYVERAQGGDRHWSFFDNHYAARLQAGERLDAWEQAQPLALEVPSIMVDTSDGYRPEQDRLIALVDARRTE